MIEKYTLWAIHSSFPTNAKVLGPLLNERVCLLFGRLFGHVRRGCNLLGPLHALHLLLRRLQRTEKQPDMYMQAMATYTVHIRTHLKSHKRLIYRHNSLADLEYGESARIGTMDREDKGY